MKRRRRLAPLDPDAYLRWAWQHGPRAKGTHPLTVGDWWFEGVAVDASLTREEARRIWVRAAARTRRRQRLGLSLWVEAE